MRRERFSLLRSAASMMIIAALFAGCGRSPAEPTAIPPTPSLEVNLILNPNISDVSVGQTVALSVEASGQGLQFKWSVSRGSLSAADRPAVIYTAPDTAGLDTVAVEVSTALNTVTKSVSFNVIAPPTDTAVPTGTPTDTPIPPPPLVEIFPQAQEGEEFVFVNSGGVLTNAFVLDSDCIHNGSYGLRLSYDMQGLGNGGWGVDWSDSPGKDFDGSGLNALTFWVRGTAGQETFQIGLKDTNGKEVKVESKTVLVVTPNWSPVRVEFSSFQGVNTRSIENVNLGFNKAHTSGTICIDDIAFVP